MPVIRLYGYPEGYDIRHDLGEFIEKFELAVIDRKIEKELANEVVFVQVHSVAREIISGNLAPYVEIYADCWTFEGELITIARVVRDALLINDQPIGIEIIWSDGTRNYFPKGTNIPAGRPTSK